MNKSLKKIAKEIVETSSFDKESNTLFVSNPAISADTLKNWAKKYNVKVGKTKLGEYISVPLGSVPSASGEWNLYDDFMLTYTYFEKNYDVLLKAYKTFDLMDENLAEVSLVLDTYTAEVLAQGFVDNPLKININNNKAKALIDKVFIRNKIHQKLPNIVRSIAKYGNYGMTLSYPYLEEMLLTTSKEKDEDVLLDNIDISRDLIISCINPKLFKVNCDQYLNVINYDTTIENNYASVVKAANFNEKRWQPWQFVHFSIIDEITEPYGKSMLWSMRSAFDQLTTLEALLAVSRASKIQRLVFNIPLPTGTSLTDGFGYLNEFKANYLNSMFTDQNSVKSGRKIAGAMSILTLPEAHDGKKVSIDQIEAKIDLSSIEDVEYFLEKILRNSKLSKGYLVGEDVITTAETLEAQDLKLKRTLIPLKKAFLDGMLLLIENILTHAGFDISSINVEVSIDEPIQIPMDTIAKYNSIADLLKNFIEVNPEMSEINKYQFLIKLGVPSELAALVSSKVTIATSDDNIDLKKFLQNQRIKEKNGKLPAADGLGEASLIVARSKDKLFTESNISVRNIDKRKFYLVECLQRVNVDD